MYQEQSVNLITCLKSNLKKVKRHQSVSKAKMAYHSTKQYNQTSILLLFKGKVQSYILVDQFSERKTTRKKLSLIYIYSNSFFSFPSFLLFNFSFILVLGFLRQVFAIQPGQLDIQTRLASNLWQSSCFNLPYAWITGMIDHACLSFY